MKVRSTLLVVAVLSVGMLATRIVVASPIAVTVLNPSFELPDQPDGDTFATATMTNWTTVNGPGIYDPQDAQFLGTTGDNVQGSLPDGGQIAIATTYFGGPFTRSFSQQLADTVGANTIYSLTVAIGARADLQSGGWRIELLAGPTLGTATQIAMATANTGPALGTWADHSAASTPHLSGDPLVGQNLFIQITGFNTPGNTLTAQTQYDNVRLTADALPEPASLGVLGVVMVVAGCRRQRLCGQ